MQTIDDKRLRNLLGTLEEGAVALREAADRMERAVGVEPPRPRPALALVDENAGDVDTK